MGDRAEREGLFEEGGPSRSFPDLSHAVSYFKYICFDSTKPLNSVILNKLTTKGENNVLFLMFSFMCTICLY